METWAIRLDGVSKRFLIGQRRWYLPYLAAALLPDGIRRWENTDRKDSFWALRDFDLTVEKGTSVGIIGANGVGKTTLLSLISGITTASAGEVRVRGRIGAMIQLGAGFHPDLSGRENVFLYAAMLGMARAEVRRRYDGIVAFSGLEKFIDTPLKRYSSGMMARLGYAVAAHVEPDILLVDEVLAVGDEAFQVRCMAHMESLRSAGRTIVLVSHYLPQVEAVCDRTIWIDRGRIRMDGPSKEVIRNYLESVQPSPNVSPLLDR